MTFDFFAPNRILFGRGRLTELAPLSAALGRHALLVTGVRSARASGLLDEVAQGLARAGVAVTPFHVAGEPETFTVDEAASLACREGCDLVIGLGGGSVLDAAKAVAVLVTNGGRTLDYMEVIGRGQPLARPGLPVVAVPTTAGTGAEATRNAVLGHAPARRKASLRHEFLMPRYALVDPALTDTLPPAVTAASGLDALTQLIEAYLSRRANPMIDALALDGIRRATRALPRAWADGRDAEARDDLALAALESGLALTSAGLGAVHGFSGPLGGRFPIPHGFACAALLPHVFGANARLLLEADSTGATAARLAVLAETMLHAAHVAVPAGGTGRTASRSAEVLVEEAAAFLHDLCRRLEVPRLGAFGVREGDLPALVAQARTSSSMRDNPVALSDDDLLDLLTAAL